MKKFATLVLATVMMVLFFYSNTAYACECGCRCDEEEQQTVEKENFNRWEDIMYEEHSVYFPIHNFYFQNVCIENLEGKKVIEMGTFSFLMELEEDNRLLIEFYPPGDIGSRIDPANFTKKEDAIQLGESDVYAYGVWESVSFLHTGEMIFEIPIDEEDSQMILIYENPMYGWTMELVQFEEEPFT